MVMWAFAAVLAICWSPQASAREFRGSRSLAVLQRRQEPDSGQVDPSYPSKYSPCSCDCCLTAARSAAEVVTLSTGEKLVRKCVSPPPSYQTEVCTDRCTPAA